MGLLGNEKKMLVVNYEQLLRAVFSCFHGQKFDFFFFFNLGSTFFGLNIFLGLTVLVL
jgi:hypothetical protein